MSESRVMSHVTCQQVVLSQQPNWCEWLSCRWIISKTISSSFGLYNHKPELCWIRYNKWRLSFWCKASRETLPSHCCLTLSKREAEGWKTTVQVRQSKQKCGWNSIWTAAVLVSIKNCQYFLSSTIYKTLPIIYFQILASKIKLFKNSIFNPKKCGTLNR